MHNWCISHTNPYLRIFMYKLCIIFFYINVFRFSFGYKFWTHDVKALDIQRILLKLQAIYVKRNIFLPCMTVFLSVFILKRIFLLNKENSEKNVNTSRWMTQFKLHMNGEGIKLPWVMVTPLSNLLRSSSLWIPSCRRRGMKLDFLLLWAVLSGTSATRYSMTVARSPTKLRRRRCRRHRCQQRLGRLELHGAGRVGSGGGRAAEGVQNS